MRVCPREDNFPESYCYGSGMWNELACSCFSPIQCMMMCEPGMRMDPRSGCTCVDRFELRADLYPSWATPYDISKSIDKTYDFFNRISEI